MALVVEDGSGKSDAESYQSVAGADAYHSVLGHSAWTGTDATKEQALRLATQWLDTSYKKLWAGARWSDDQALDWPRAGVVVDSLSYDSDELPPQLVNACAELALKVIGGDTLFADMSDGATVASQTVRVGPITESKSFIGGSRGIKRYRLVEAMLDALVNAPTQLERA